MAATYMEHGNNVFNMGTKTMECMGQSPQN